MRKISDSAMALVKRIFERNADAQAAYVTSDDQVFRSENDALGQANNLKRAGKSADVVTVLRNGVVSDELGGGPAKDMTEEEVAAAVVAAAKDALTKATAKRADAQAVYDAAVEAKGKLPEGAHVNTVKAADKRIEKALAVLAEAESELEAAEAALAELGGE
jgi:uncharacterized protein YgiM (DUF1202 family)